MQRIIEAASQHNTPTTGMYVLFVLLVGLALCLLWALVKSEAQRHRLKRQVVILQHVVGAVNGGTHRVVRNERVYDQDNDLDFELRSLIEREGEGS